LIVLATGRRNSTSIQTAEKTDTPVYRKDARASTRNIGVRALRSDRRYALKTNANGRVIAFFIQLINNRESNEKSTFGFRASEYRTTDRRKNVAHVPVYSRSGRQTHPTRRVRQIAFCFRFDRYVPPHRSRDNYYRYL